MRRGAHLPVCVCVVASVAWSGGEPATPAEGSPLPVRALTLDDFEATAIDNGIQGRLTALALESAGYTRTIAYRQTDAPQMTASYEAEREEVRTNRVSSIRTPKTARLDISQPTVLGTQINATALRSDTQKPGISATLNQPLYLFTWNASLRNRRRADTSFANARDTFDASILSLRRQARSLYYEVMLGDESILVEERKVAASRRLVEITQALVEAGKSAPVETMRAKIRSQTDERQLQNAVTARDQAILNAKNFVNWPLQDPLQFTSRLDFKPFSVNLDRLIEYALVHRPALRSLRREILLARWNRQETTEAARPTFALTSSYGYDEFTNATTRSWSMGGQARWLFFDGFIARDRTRIARINEWVADLNLLGGERDTRAAVGNAYLDVKRTERQIQAFQSSREQARRNVEVLRLRFQNGLERLIDVFDAENEMRDLDNEYLGLLVAYNRAKDELSELIGGNVESIR